MVSPYPAKKTEMGEIWSQRWVVLNREAEAGLRKIPSLGSRRRGSWMRRGSGERLAAEGGGQGVRPRSGCSAGVRVRGSARLVRRRAA